MLRRLLSVCLFALTAVSGRADVTVRQAMEFHIKMALPAGQQLPAPFNGPVEILARVKGERAYTTFGSMVVITDAAKNRITLIDNPNKRYATGSLSDYMAMAGKGFNAAALPPQALQLLANIKVDADSHETGRSERIQGIDAVEREVIVNISIPIPVPMPGLENGLQLTGKFECWQPKAGEIERVPALRELVAYRSHAGRMGDPGAIVKQMFGALPGLGDNIQKLVDELSKGGPVHLRIHGALFVPGLAAIMAQARANGANVPDVPGPDSPLVELSIEMKDLSADPVPDSVFEVPEGYQTAAMEDLAKGMMAGASKK